MLKVAAVARGRQADRCSQTATLGLHTQWPAYTTNHGHATHDRDTYIRKVVATDPERMWAEDADVLTAKLEPGFMLQARYLVIIPRAGLHAAGPGDTCYGYTHYGHSYYGSTHHGHTHCPTAYCREGHPSRPTTWTLTRRGTRPLSSRARSSSGNCCCTTASS